MRWLADGTVEFLGRIDTQVKLRGFRIEPGEVEAVLREHAGVREAVVLVAAEAQRLVAYVVPQEGVELRAAELRAYLSGRLPEYMVPGAFVALEQLPRNVSGKVDRRALPAPEQESAAYVAPRTAAEEVLAGIWAEVLHVERVGRGGELLRAGRALAAGDAGGLAGAAGVRGGGAAAGAVRGAHRGGAGRARGGAARGGRHAGAADRAGAAGRSRCRCRSRSSGSGWWTGWSRGARRTTWPGRCACAARWTWLRCGRASTRWCERHETLRTTFAERDGAPVQVIHPPAPVALAEQDLRDLPEAEREAAAERLAEEEALRPFDLERGPLLRGTLLRLGEDDHVLLFTLHHVVSDGWSMQVLVREVSALYGAFSRGEEPRLPELPVQYADYAVWQRAWLSGDVLEAQVGYWKERLAGAPPLLELPTDRPRALGQSAAGGDSPLRALRGGDAGAAGALAARGDDAVHDGAGGVAGAAVRATRARRTWWWAAPSRGGRGGRRRG